MTYITYPNAYPPGYVPTAVPLPTTNPFPIPNYSPPAWPVASKEDQILQKLVEIIELLRKL